MTTQTEPREQADVLATLAVIAAVASVILTVAAFWLSYEHLHDVASRYGLGHSAVRSWAWPATVDLFILIGEVLILRAALARLGIDPWAIALTIVGSGGSIALNVAGVGSHAQPMDYVVAAVPPIAALLAFGALMRQLHGALAARVESVVEAPQPAENQTLQSASANAPTPAPEAPPAPAPERPEATIQSAPQDAPGAPAEAPRTVKPERPQSAPKAKAKAPSKAPRKAPAKRPQSATRADAKAAIEALYDKKQGRPLEGEMTAALIALKTYPHTSRQHANKLRAEVERERPDLAALGSDNVYALTGS